MRQILPIVNRTIGFEISRCTLQRIVSQRKKMESIPKNYGEMKRMKLSDPLRLEFDKQAKLFKHNIITLYASSNAFFKTQNRFSRQHFRFQKLIIVNLIETSSFRRKFPVSESSKFSLKFQSLLQNMFESSKSLILTPRVISVKKIQNFMIIFNLSSKTCPKAFNR